MDFTQQRLGAGVMILHQLIELGIRAGGKLIRTEISTLNFSDVSIKHRIHEKSLWDRVVGGGSRTCDSARV